MKRSSRKASSGTRNKVIRLSKSQMQKMVVQEIQRTIKNNEAKMQELIETIQQLESSVDYESSIQKLEARINVVAKRAEAALSYITGKKMDKKNQLVTVNITTHETVRTAPEDKTITDSVVKDTELFQLMDNAKEALKTMHSENEAVKAAMTGLNEELPPPVLTPYGSPNTKVRVRLIKNEPEEQEQVQFEEPMAKRVKVEHVSENQNARPKPRKSQGDELSYPPLPSTPFPSILNMEAASYSIPQKPQVHVALIKDPPGLSVLWKVEKEDPCAAPMDSYSIYMTTEKAKGSGVFPDWKIIGEVRAIELPMCVMIKKYKPEYRLCVAVVGKDVFNRFGPFSKVISVVIPNSSTE